jgi:hypothetical protein
MNFIVTAQVSMELTIPISSFGELGALALECSRVDWQLWTTSAGLTHKEENKVGTAAAIVGQAIEAAFADPHAPTLRLLGLTIERMGNYVVVS